MSSYTGHAKAFEMNTGVELSMGFIAYFGTNYHDFGLFLLLI